MKTTKTKNKTTQTKDNKSPGGKYSRTSTKPPHSRNRNQNYKKQRKNQQNTKKENKTTPPPEHIRENRNEKGKLISTEDTQRMNKRQAQIMTHLRKENTKHHNTNPPQTEKQEKTSSGKQEKE